MSKKFEGKTIGVREIKLTLNFVTPEEIYQPEYDYNIKINEYVKRFIIDACNGNNWDTSSFPPILVDCKAEDITD